MKFALLIENPAVDEIAFSATLPALLRDLAAKIESNDCPRHGSGRSDGAGGFRLRWDLSTKETHQ